jgi:hypothetical protein
MNILAKLISALAENRIRGLPNPCHKYWPIENKDNHGKPDSCWPITHSDEIPNKCLKTASLKNASTSAGRVTRE